MDAEEQNLRLYYLFLIVILMGIMQVLAVVFKPGKFVRLIPHPVMTRFVNGFIIILLAQLKMFKKILMENTSG